ncbi:MAG: glycoside hydrolase family 16 protein [Bacteroidaceae bacterium]|nr:glycoside hydrolase family 16 protein [Bacteroidaceae bacterium]
MKKTINSKHLVFAIPFVLILMFGTIIFYSTNAFAQVQQPIEQPQYELFWEDNFDGKQLDTNSWSFMKRRDSAAGRYFSSNKSLYNISKGRIRLYGRQNKGIAANDTASYLTCGIETFGHRHITYGKVEVRARLHEAQGAWPAIWLRGVDKKFSSYPDYAELDIMEHLNYDGYVHQTVHNNYIDKLNKKNSPLYQIKATVDSGEWNVYAVEILPDRIIYSVNGKQTMVYPKIQTDDYGQFPFGCEMHLMIDMQLGGKWVGQINARRLPAYMDIDWVRMYKLKNSVTQSSSQQNSTERRLYRIGD